MGGLHVQICCMNITVLLALDFKQTIKIKDLSLKAMCWIGYKNMNSNFIGHLGLEFNLGLHCNRYMCVESGTGTGIINWTTDNRICMRDEIF